MKEYQINGTTIRLIQGDITEQDVEAVVNAANSSLMGGGGVDGAIHRKGGDAILKECKEIRNDEYPDGLPTGEAVLTTAGKLPADHVIHTVGPRWKDGHSGERDQLADAYRNSLEIAEEEGLESVAFPSISTGAYGYPIDQAARVALETVADFLEDNDTGIDEVRFVLFSEDDLATYEEALGKI
ncbi:MAG: O-acetyl-ADP-ribose deacetylase [Myxococcota bacterium]